MPRLVNPACKTSTLNESPSEKEGKLSGRLSSLTFWGPSMKVPPKRKGNSPPAPSTLNESPSEKEGKFKLRSAQP